MRDDASIVHVDLDAFFASVEQRDKPSLRGKPVIVGGIGLRGVVSTASYEARAYGARSAMSTAEARAITPAGTAFLWPRFDAYRRSSLVVMDILRSISPLVEQVSIDEAYVDLRGSDLPDLAVPTIRRCLESLSAKISVETGGLSASAGAASSKMMAKIGSELNKPAGITVIEPGTEQDVLAPMTVRALAGIGPATEARLRTFGVTSVADLRRMDITDLVSIFGERHGRGLYALARARDERELTLSREAKSVSAEETFERDVYDRTVMRREIRQISVNVSQRITQAGLFSRTVHLKVRLPDFTPITRSFTTNVPTRDPEVIADIACRLLDALELPSGIRLLGVGVSGFVPFSQDELFELAVPGEEPEMPEVPQSPALMPDLEQDLKPDLPAPSEMTPDGSIRTAEGHFVTDLVPSSPEDDGVPTVSEPPIASGGEVAAYEQTSDNTETPCDPQRPEAAAVKVTVEGDSAAGVADITKAVNTVPGEETIARIETRSSATSDIGTRFSPPAGPAYRPGSDVLHDEFGAGWVWGSGRGRVTVRFEGPTTPPGPIRTFLTTDPQLRLTDPPAWKD